MILYPLKNKFPSFRSIEALYSYAIASPHLSLIVTI